MPRTGFKAHPERRSSGGIEFFVGTILLLLLILASIRTAAAAEEALTPSDSDPPLRASVAGEGAASTFSNASDFEVAVFGPSCMQMGATAFFYAEPLGGTPPYTYSWSSTGTITPFTENTIQVTAHYFDWTLSVFVTVTDANGEWGWGGKSVRLTGSPTYTCYY